MAARKTFTNTKTIVATPRKTSIGDGRRKRGPSRSGVRSLTEDRVSESGGLLHSALAESGRAT